MRIAVISDTHLHFPTEPLLHLYEAHMAHADALLHLGDVTGEATLAFFLNHPRFFGVAGNMDEQGVADHLPAMRKVELGGLVMGMAHGRGFGHDPGPALVRHFGAGTDLVLFGHTHVFQWTEHQGALLLNPGSATSPRRGGPTMAVLHLTPGLPPEVERIELPQPL